ncbi:MAG TPA: DUF1552 domain-containing protein [Polyangia bacterium]|nr:DUF1552 domain-containing protein [Polyangia bacterium]
MFLRGLGGAVVAAPFLPSVWERQAKGQAASPGPAKAFIAMFTHYGCVTTKFFPAKSHGALATTDLVNSIAPLAPYMSKLLIVRGMRGMNEWTENNTNGGGKGQGNDPHLNPCGSYFTLQPVTPNSNDPFSFTQATKFNAQPVGSSLDHIMAQQLSSTGTPLFMRVGNSGGTKGESPQSNISYLKSSTNASDAADIYPGLGTPSQVFSALTGLFMTGTGTTTTPGNTDTYASTRGQKISDLVKGELESLKRFDMSSDDKNKLNAWEALLNSTGSMMMTGGGGVASAMCTSAEATMLEATSANVMAAGSAGSSGDLLTNKISSDLDGADMYSVMAVLSTICNYNPVIFLKYPPNYYFKGLGITDESHNLSHRLSNANMTGTCVANALMKLETIDTYYASKFAKLIGMLNGITNPDGSTLLDSTVTTWFNEMSDGNAHNLNNLPVIQAGGGGGYFKTGWTVNVDTSTSTSAGVTNLSQGMSEAQCADGSTSGQVNGLTQATGTDTKVANGPINKYFYNIMNAMGVKADSTGFPAKGGTAPVTRFGYSDQTADFDGGLGGVKGATIHDPGEYTALKSGS